MATEWDTWKNLYKCMCKTGGHISPHSLCGGPWVNVYNSVRRISRWRRKCVHWFLFLSGKNWCWNVRNAASSFRRVLPKSIENIWVGFPFKKWALILWRRPPPRQAFHLPHWGDHGTFARNHSCWPTSIREVAEEVRIAFGMFQKILTEDLWMRRVTVKFVLSPNGGTEGRVSLHWPPWLSPKRSQLHVLGNHGWRMLVYGYDPETKQMSSQ